MYQVIIADDKTRIRSGLANLFPWSQLGLEIADPFSNGRGVCDSTLSGPVDLTLSDIRIPLADRLELSERLLPRKKVKVISFSGYQDFDYVWKALHDDVFDRLLKPAEHEDLADYPIRIKELLDSKQGQNVPEACESLSYYEKIINTVKNYLGTSHQGATLEQVARLASLSPSYLSGIMKEHPDTSFSDYLLEAQIENTARILGDIGYKQYEIVYQVGCNNPRNSSRTSHRYSNMASTQYRNCSDRPEPQL